MNKFSSVRTTLSAGHRVQTSKMYISKAEINPHTTSVRHLNGVKDIFGVSSVTVVLIL